MLCASLTALARRASLGRPPAPFGASPAIGPAAWARWGEVEPMQAAISTAAQAEPPPPPAGMGDAPGGDRPDPAVEELEEEEAERWSFQGHLKRLRKRDAPLDAEEAPGEQAPGEEAWTYYYEPPEPCPEPLTERGLEGCEEEEVEDE